MVYARSVTCPRCGAEFKPGQKFCANCGLALAACPNCGAPTSPARSSAPIAASALPGERAATAAGQTDVAPAAPPAAERRYVSILFADLVGFTPLPRSRIPRQVRDLLSRYFDSRARGDRALRRHGREVHRRRGHGRVGRSCRARGRCRARSSRRARAGRRVSAIDASADTPTRRCAPACFG